MTSKCEHPSITAVGPEDGPLPIDWRCADCGAKLTLVSVEPPPREDET